MFSISQVFPRLRRNRDNAAVLYGAIVTQARCAELYSEIGVPDTISGRFEMIVLHAILLTRRLGIGDKAARVAGQAVFDHFCRDMDNSLREMGIGDLSVPKHMRRVGEAYFGRMAVYERGLDAGNSIILAEAIERTIFNGGGISRSAQLLADYALAAADELGKQAEHAIVGGRPSFPNVRIVVAASVSI